MVSGMKVITCHYDTPNPLSLYSGWCDARYHHVVNHPGGRAYTDTDGLDPATPSLVIRLSPTSDSKLCLNQSKSIEVRGEGSKKNIFRHQKKTFLAEIKKNINRDQKTHFLETICEKGRGCAHSRRDQKKTFLGIKKNITEKRQKGQ